MATITASATGGNWSATAAWVGGVVPTSTDDVLLTAASGNITVDGIGGSPSLCQSLDCTTYTGTFTFGGSAWLNIGSASGGLLKFVAGMTVTPGTGTLNLVASSGTYNVTTANKGSGILNFSGGATYNIQDANSSISAFTVSAGIVNTNNNNLTVNTFNIGASGTFNLGSSTIKFTTWINNGTVGVGTSTLQNNASGASSLTDNSSTAYNAFTYNASNALCAFVGAMSFTTMSVTGACLSNNNNIGLSLTNNLTVGTLTLAGVDAASNRLFVASAVPGTQVTLSVTTLTASNVDFADINATGSANWNLSAITGGSGDRGNNTGITFSTPINCYMKTAANVNWSAANWYTTSGGSTHARVPLPQDTAVFDANSFTTSNKIVTVDGVMCGSVNWTGVTNTPTWKINTAQTAQLNAYGSITLSSGVTASGTAILALVGRGTNTITNGGITATWPILVDCVGGSYTHQDNYTSSQTFQLNSGTYSDGGHNVTFTKAVLDAVSTARTFTMNGNFTVNSTGTVWTATTSGLTISGSGTLIMGNTAAAAKTMAMGANTYPNVTINGAASNGILTISGAHTVTGTHTIQPDASVKWTKTTTYTLGTIAWTGTSGHPITMVSSTNASPYTISSGNLVSCDWLSLRDSTANSTLTGYPKFFAGANSTSVSGNTNWQFTIPMVSLTALCKCATFMRGTVSVYVALSGICTAQAKGMLTNFSTNAAALFARCVSQARMQGAMTGALPLSGKTSGQAKASSSFTLRASLSGLTKSQAKVRAGMTLAVAMAAFCVAQFKASGSINGTLPLSGKTAGQAKGSARLSGSVPLAARAMGQAKASASFTLRAALAGLSVSQAKVSAAITLAAAMAAFCVAQFKAHGDVKGTLTLSGTTNAQSYLRGGMVGTVPLQGKSTSQAKASGFLSGLVLLSGRTAGQMKASTPIIVNAFLSARATAMAKMSASIAGTVPLAGRATAQAKAFVAPTFKFLLFARTAIMAKMRGMVKLHAAGEPATVCMSVKQSFPVSQNQEATYDVGQNVRNAYPVSQKVNPKGSCHE